VAESASSNGLTIAVFSILRGVRHIVAATYGLDRRLHLSSAWRNLSIFAIGPSYSLAEPSLKPKAAPLIAESHELIAILYAIIKTARNSTSRGRQL
jgi:hypothetical protein